jgi:hypothetical protein
MLGMEIDKAMTSQGRIFKAFSNFGSDEVPREAVTSRLMLRRLEDIDNGTTARPVTPAGRAALASSVVHTLWAT